MSDCYDSISHTQPDDDDDDIQDDEVKRGIATSFWLELKLLPPNDTPHYYVLWLRVDGRWRRLKPSSPEINASVQSAFCPCRESLEVAVWWNKKYPREIIGLVVRSR